MFSSGRTTASQKPSGSLFSKEAPRLAPIRRFIKPALLPRPARHHNRRLRVPRLHSAKIQRSPVRRRIRHRALHPVRPAIRGLQNCAFATAGPRHLPIYRIDAAQAGRCPRLLHLKNLPRGTIRRRRRSRRRLRQTQTTRNAEKQGQPPYTHGWKYKANPPAHQTRKQIK